MKKHEIEIKKTLKEFTQLNKALIDASSIIYLHKIGIFDIVSNSLSLHTIQEIIEETGYKNTQITIVSSNPIINTNDKKIIDKAEELNLPIISEDKKILIHFQKQDIPFFNSLMILNYLFFREKIDNRAYQFYLNDLKKVARYGNQIWEYGEIIHSSIMIRRKECLQTP